MKRRYTLHQLLPTPSATLTEIHDAARKILGIRQYASIKHLSRATIWLLCKESLINRNKKKTGEKNE